MKHLITFLAAFCALSGTSLAAEPERSADSQRPRPNVLFILSDDLRPELGCYGAPVQTPNLDKLAARGVRFERAYCQYPLCNPSRASLMTGRLPTATGVFNNGTDFRKLHPDWVTLPQFFKNHGYISARHGKNFHGGIDDPLSWSEGAEGPRTPRPRGPQAPKAAPAKPAAETPATGQPTTQPTGEVTAQMRTSDRRVVLPGEGEAHGDFQTANSTIAALERLKSQPFFITCGFNKPHAEPAAPQRFYDLYPPDKITLPADFAPFPKPPPGFPAGALPARNTDLFWNREATADEARLMIQAYRASTSWMDWNAGRVLDALDRLGLRETTIVALWGDHGYHLGEMGKWSKHGSLFDIGTRVPLIIAAPGRKGAGRSSPRIVQTLDIYPTLAALCGLTPPAALDGHDLRPLLDDPSARWEHPAFSFAGAAQAPHRTIRTERWRYIEWTGPDGGPALIDEQADPHERTNLAAKPEHAATVAELKQRLAAAMKSTTSDR
jgi:iduronate 2-sulfatase